MRGFPDLFSAKLSKMSLPPRALAGRLSLSSCSKSAYKSRCAVSCEYASVKTTTKKSVDRISFIDGLPNFLVISRSFVKHRKQNLVRKKREVFPLPHQRFGLG